MEPQPLHILLVDSPEASLPLCDWLAPQAPDDPVHWVTHHRCKDGALPEDLPAIPVDIVLLACTEAPDLEQVRMLHASLPGAVLVAIGDREEPEIEAEVLAAGAQAYLVGSHLTRYWLHWSLHRLAANAQVEHSLATAEGCLTRAFFRASPNLLAITRLDDGAILEVNGSFEQVLGYARTEVLGRTAQDLGLYVHLDDGARIRKRLERAGAVRGWEIDLRTKAGDIRRMALSVEPITVAGEAQWLTILRDLTEQRQFQEALQRSEERYRALVGATMAIIWTVDPEGRFITPQPSWEAYTGQPWAEHQGFGWFDAIHPEDRERLMAVWQESVCTLTAYRCTGRLWHAASQSFRHFDVRAVPLFGDDGAVREWVGACRDVHVVEEARAAVRLSEERFRLAARAVAGLIYDWNLVTGEIYRSDGMVGVIGLHPKDAPQDRDWWPERIHPDDLPRILSNFDRTLRSASTTYESEYRVRHENGHWVDLWDRGYILRDSSGRAVRVIGSAADISERKQMEAALRAEEERFRQLADAMPQLVWVAEPDGTVIYYNQRWREFQGIGPKADGSWEWAPVLHPDDRQPTVEAWRHAVETGETYTIEHRITRADGQVCWYLSRGVPAHDEQGRIVRWYGTATDIHDLKLAEQAVRESEARLNLALQAGKMVAWAWDPAEDRFSATDNFPEIFGTPTIRTAAEGAAFVLPEDLDHHWVAVQHAATHGGNYHTEYRIRRADTGQISWIEEWGMAVPNPEGQVEHLVGIAMDISARKQLEQALLASEAHVRKVLNNLFAFVGVLTPEGILLEANRAPLEMAGIRLDDVYGRHFADCYWWSYSPAIQAQLRDTIARARQGEAVRFDVDVRVAGGELIAIDFMLAPLFDEQGKVQYLIPSGVDITARKELEAALRHARDEMELRVVERTQELAESNRRLEQEIREREQAENALREVRRRLAQSREAERLHLAQELHDGPLQELSALGFRVAQVAQSLDGESQGKEMTTIRTELAEVTRQLRLLTQSLRPPILTHFGLPAAIRAHAQQIQESRATPDLEVDVADDVGTLPEEAALALFRIYQQAVQNALQHARATRIHVRLWTKSGTLGLGIEDDGCGFVLPTSWVDLTRQGHLGVAGMAERAEGAGATFSVASEPGKGTCVAVTMPQPQPPAG